MEEIVNNILSVTGSTFSSMALQVFRLQYAQNQVYRNWVNALNVPVDRINHLSKIPFLPISFFKTHEVITGKFVPQTVFESSGTTTTINSRHFVKDVALYTQSFLKGFTMNYGDPLNYCIIGLLPSYLERKGSSLVAMVDELIRQSGHRESGFYLYEFKELARVLTMLEKAKQPTILIGVTFALLDFAEQFPIPLQHTIVMETGGMKGRRKEWIREEVHRFLCEKFALQTVHSEYGMTELLSQGYSAGEGIFTTVPWMKVLVREENDPLQTFTSGRGLINVIDLANVHSCSFIATDDVGELYSNGRFSVLGRHDNSDIRGCSLLAI